MECISLGLTWSWQFIAPFSVSEFANVSSMSNGATRVCKQGLSLVATTSLSSESHSELSELLEKCCSKLRSCECSNAFCSSFAK